MEQQEIDRLISEGEKKFAEGDYEAARKCFTRVLEAEFNNAAALNNLGVLAFQLELYNEAVSFFNQLLDFDPENYNALVNLGKCWAEMGNFERAIELLETSIRVQGPVPDVLNTIAACCYQLNLLDDARAFAKQSLDLQPRQQEMQALLKKISSEQREIAARRQALLHGRRLRLGFVSIWFERGQAYVTRTLRDALAKDHEVFLFARTGGVHGKPMLETSGDWHVPNMTTFPEYKIPANVLREWIRENQLDAVIFNEEYDWSLVEACRQEGIATLTYLDYYKNEWREKLNLYDGVLCSTRRTFNMVKYAGQAYFIGWGIDTELFQPAPAKKKFTFFHNAGWLGINYRKMTPAAILAFDAVAKIFPEITLFVHAQCELEKLPPQVVRIVLDNSRITYHVETVSAPGLYHRGKILLFPTKLEGLGLPLLEGLACGLPAIATDAPPMNEFVQDGYNGLLVKVAKTVRRSDYIAFPETIVDVNDLAQKMARLARDHEFLQKLQKNARFYAETELSSYAFRRRLVEAVEDTIARTRSETRMQEAISS